MRGYYVAGLLYLIAVKALASDGNGLSRHSIWLMPVDTNLHKDTSKADDADDEDIKHREFAIGLEAANDQNNHGLHNKGKALPYFEPSFTYTAKSGFYIEVDDQYLIPVKGIPKKRAGFDVFGLNPGWDWDVSDNTTINANITYNKFKAKTPNLIKSNLFLTLESYLDQYIVGELEGRFTADYDIYKKPTTNQPTTPNDIIFTPDLQYTFEWDFSKKGSLSVIPEANVEFGTRNFYTSYQNNVIDSTVGSSKKTTYVAENANSSFGTLDYNIILSIELKLGAFSIEPVITYAHPLYNPSNLSNPPIAYGSITLTYTIKSKK